MVILKKAEIICLKIFTIVEILVNPLTIQGCCNPFSFMAVIIVLRRVFRASGAGLAAMAIYQCTMWIVRVSLWNMLGS